MKRFWVVLVVFLLASCLGLTRADAADIMTDIELGFDGTYKLGKWTELKLTIENTGKDIEGSIEATVPYSYEKNNIYSLPVSIPASSTKEYSLVVPIERFAHYIDIRLLDDKGKLIEKKTIRNLSVVTESEYMLGIITDDEASLGYFKEPSKENIFFSNYYPVNLTAESFPDRVELLDNFEVIIVNNIDTSKMSKKQLAALESWVKAGGILVTGTGANARRTLSGLSPSIVPVTTAGSLTLDKSYSLEEMGWQILQGGALNVIELKASQDASILISEDEIPIVIMNRIGNGYVYTAAFDLGTEPILSWEGKINLWNNIFQESLASSKSISLTDPAYNAKTSMPSYVLGNIPTMGLPPASLVLFIFLLYLAMIGPINYFVLKKIDKRELSWITIPAISILFAVFIYSYAFTTKGNEMVANTISIVELDKDSGQGQLVEHVGLFFGRRGDYLVEIDSEGLVSLMGDPYYGFDNDPNYAAKNIEARVVQGPSTKIEFDNVNIWTMKTFKIDKTIVDMGKVEADLSFTDGKIVGRITNNTIYPLDDFVIYTMTSYQNLGNIAAGESKNVTLDILDPSYYPYGDSLYQIIEELYPYHGYLSEDRQEIEVRREMLSYVLNTNEKPIETVSSNIMLGAQFLAFYEDGSRGRVLINGKEPDESMGQGLIVGELEIEWENDGYITIPEGIIKGSFEYDMSLGTNWEGAETYFYDRDSYAVYSFDLSKYRDLDDLAVTINTYFDPSIGRLEIYNANVMAYEQAGDDIFSIKDENKDTYINPGGIVYIRIYSNQQNVYIPTPSISIEGRVR